MSVPRVGRAWRWLAVALWMVLIFYLSAQPDLPHHPEATVDVILKKLGHLAEYGVLAVLVLWAVWQESQSSHRLAMLVAFALALLYALSDEMHQRFVPGRDSQPLDVAFDLVGAGLALLAVSRFYRPRSCPKGVDKEG